VEPVIRLCRAFFDREDKNVKIGEKTFVAIDYRLFLDSGEEIDRSPEGEPLAFVTGTGRILPGLEDALMGKGSGESSRVTLEAEDAYGEVDDDLFRDVPRSRFPQDAEIREGMAFTAESPRGPVPLTVARVGEDVVTVDLNHPLAGKRLHFDVTIAEVREPSEEELTQELGGCSCGCDSSEEEESCGPGCGCR
jgi:FKBP-type peptidyl-prolyl cis-trans isomerase SlyD